MQPTTISVGREAIGALDLAPARDAIEAFLAALAVDVRAIEWQVSFAIDYPREPGDPRELSEMEEVRLWFIRLDATYPWLPYVLDWRSGELARYAAMLVPHQFSKVDGIEYNPEAIAIFVMHKLFTIAAWLRQYGLGNWDKLQQMAQTLGWEVDRSFFDLL